VTLGRSCRPEGARTHVDSDTLPSRSTRSTDATNVIFTVSAYKAAGLVRFKPSTERKHLRRQVVVDHEGDLLHIDPPRLPSVVISTRLWRSGSGG
jgi:hypothetical protein